MDGDSTTTASSSAPSPSSPEASFHSPPSLERLISHFVTAKHSLTSMSRVARANSLVTQGRTMIEDIATTIARNSFAMHGIDEQLETLNAIRDGIWSVSVNSAREFTETVRVLDDANDRLQRTLEMLRETFVDAALQRTGDNASGPPTVEEGDDGGDEGAGISSDQQRRQGKTLYHFIDETRHQDIETSLRTLIDNYNAAQSDLQTLALASLDDHLLGIAMTLRKDRPISGSSTGPQDKHTLYDEPHSSISELFHNMDTHAGEMATLLQNLVAHYDLCVAALKHTEGGGEAAKQAVQQAEELSNEGAAAEESLYRKKVPEPMGEAERAEMLRVVESDASEVEEVVGEIREHAEGMEREFRMLRRHALDARAGHKALRDVLDRLYEIKELLPRYISHTRKSRASWSDTRSAIEQHTLDLSSLSHTYEHFMTSYSHLLEEVERRKAADSAVQKFVTRAQRELDKLHEADAQARRGFIHEFGDSLPGDIWPGARSEGRRWEVRPVRGEDEDEL